MRALPNVLRGQVDDARIALKVCFVAVPLIAGLDKFFNLLTDWSHYLSPTAVSVLPVAPQTAMYVVGVIEIVVGLFMLSRWTAEASLVVTAWLALIALNLVAAGFYDIAVRDVVMAVGAYTLAC